MKNRKSLRADIILIVSLIVLSATAFGILFAFRERGKRVIVEVDGKIVAEYSLDEEGEYAINGGTNILVIEGGEAYMKSADCPDRTCVRTGRIKYSGQTIVCLPNRVAVSVMGKDTSGVDLVS